MINFFEIFSLPLEFEVDVNDIENKYLQLQLEYHPDKVGNDIKKISFSADINNAYITLKDNYKRAEHILLLNGIDLTIEEGGIKVDHETLVQVMEIRESLMEAEDKTAIINNINSEIAHITKKLGNHLNKQDYDIAAQEAIKLKYFQRIL